MYLRNYLGGIPEDYLETFSTLIIEKLLREKNGVTKSMCIFLQKMFGCQEFNLVLENRDSPFAVNLHKILKDEVSKTTDYDKLNALLDIYIRLFGVSGTFNVTNI